MALNIRYQYLLLSIMIIKPKSIIEIGLSRGERAYQMLQIAKKYNSDVEYYGYDVFDTKDEAWHKMVGNGKKVDSKNIIEKRLNKLTNNIHLIQGMTSETLWLNPKKADLVWLDGDHRIEAIKNDYESVKTSKLVVFDDYYFTGEHNGFTIDKFGCNKIVEELDKEEIFISPKTVNFPNIRIVFWTKNKHIIDQIRYYFSNITKTKQLYFSNKDQVL